MLRSVSRLLFMSGALCALLLPAGAGATDVNPGPVSGTWTAAGSPYVVLGHIEVPDGETLTIEAGVEVRFDGPYVLDVQGTLSADGAPSDTILFTTNTGRVAWGHIEIGADADPGSVLSYCRIENSNSTVHDSLYSRHGGGIHLSGTHGATIEYSTIADCVGAHGGGVYADGSVTVDGCAIRSCEAVNAASFQGKGGGIAAEGGATITDCVIADNSASFMGGGIGGSPASFDGAIEDCVISGNHSDYHGGGIALDHATTGSSVTGNLIYENTANHDGGGIYFWYGNVATFQYNTIARNQAVDGAGIAYGYTTSLTIDRSIIAFNVGEATKLVTWGSSLLVFDCVCAFGNEGGDALDGTTVACLAEDPLFCNIFTDNYALCANSPCRSGGPSGLIGALDVDCPSCGSAVEEMSWGRIKSLYRP